MQRDSKPRLRAPNFTNEESTLLCEVIEKYKHIIENKKIDGATLAEKSKAWVDVAKCYNSSTTGYIRTVESLQNKYIALKKNLKKKSSKAIMDIPVDKNILLDMVEEHGTSPDGWNKVSVNTGIPADACHELFNSMVEEAGAQEREERRSIMRTGGGPLQNSHNDPLMDKVRGLVGPTIEANYSIYDGDSGLIAAQEGIVPIESDLHLSDEAQTNDVTEKDTSGEPSATYFGNERGNLKKSPHPLLTRKRKLAPSKEPVSEKFRALASEKMALVSAQRELIKVQLIEEKEKLEHNRLLRRMELEDAEKRYAHNETVRKLQMEKYGK